MRAHKKYLVAGHIAKDIHIKIDNCYNLPKEFQQLIKDSISISKINHLLGKKWTFEKVINFLEKQIIAPISYSYGGRGPNIAYGAAILGANVELLGLVGSDFDIIYPGFYDGSYKNHLINAGVIINELILSQDSINKIIEEEIYGIFNIVEKEIPTIYCINDLKGNDFYFIDDIRGAHILANMCPIPKKTIKKYDGVLITSGEKGFNERIINYSFKINKDILFDVGAYNLNFKYLNRIIPMCNTIFGNLYEIDLLKKSFKLKKIEDLFDISSNIENIIVLNKIECMVKVYNNKKRAYELKINSIEHNKKISSVGCCDGIIAGYLGLYAQGYDIITAIKAGLIQCLNIWKVEGVQEGMLDKVNLFRELNKLT
ncbi:MAG: hypothetical protein ACFFDN_02980 [Candidatus Hodarchaeota archaeon]